MITRYALFEGKVKEGQTDAFRADVIGTILPKWKEFPGALDVRVSFAEQRDDGAPEIPMILAINYPDRAAVDAARVVIAEVNDQVPYSLGERIHASEIDVALPVSRAPVESPPARITATDEAGGPIRWASQTWQQFKGDNTADAAAEGESRFALASSTGRVPIWQAAIEIFKDLKPITRRSEFVFPGVRSAKRPMSENTINAALRYLGYDGDTITGHGFRAMARTVLDEVLGFRPDYIEHQLAHAVRDPLGRAYNRTAHLPERKKMMQAWADYLDSLRLNANVVPIRKAV